MEIQNRLAQINNGILCSRAWDVMRERAPGVIGGGITGFFSVPGAIGGALLGMQRMQSFDQQNYSNFLRNFHPTTLGSWGGGFLASGLAMYASYQNGNLASTIGPEYMKTWAMGVTAGTLLSAAAELAYRQRRGDILRTHNAQA